MVDLEVKDRHKVIPSKDVDIAPTENTPSIIQNNPHFEPRIVSREQILRYRRVGDLFEDLIGAEKDDIRVPKGIDVDHILKLESALNFLKHVGTILHFTDLRDPTVKEHYRQERTHDKPDFWVLLMDKQEVEVECKNFSKRLKDHPRAGYPDYFTRTLEDGQVQE